MKILLFGASKLGHEIFDNLSQKYEIVGFIDNDTQKHGKLFCGVPVYSLEDAPLTQIDKIVVSSFFKTEIFEQLKEASLEHLLFSPFEKMTPGLKWPYKMSNSLLLNQMDQSESCNGSILYDLKIFNGIHKVLSQYIAQKNNLKFLHLGAGNSLGLELMLSLKGEYQEVVAYEPFYDKFDLIETWNNYRRLFEKLNSYGEVLLHEKFVLDPYISELDKGTWKVNETTIHVDSDRLFEDNLIAESTFDVIYSNAVLEHVRDPLKTITECRRILKPGGLAVHQIDLRDHEDFDNPLEFLKVSAEEWVERMAYRGGSYLNRWRSCNYIEGLQQNGFEIELFKSDKKLAKEDVLKELPYFADEFQSISVEDHRILSCFIIARKKS